MFTDTIDSTETKSTGPRTEQGKAISAQNARKSGLFATRDFIRSEEREEYEELRDSLQADLSPEGALESHIAAEILGALWRLRRCAQLESELTGLQDPMDPMSPQAKQQLSIDRARNQATRLLHKNTSELRSLQTERQFRREIAADGIEAETPTVLCDLHTAMSRADRAVKNAQRFQYEKLKNELDTMELEGHRHTLERAASAGLPISEVEITKRTPPAQPERSGDILQQAA